MSCHKEVLDEPSAAREESFISLECLVSTFLFFSDGAGMMMLGSVVPDAFDGVFIIDPVGVTPEDCE